MTVEQEAELPREADTAFPISNRLELVLPQSQALLYPSVSQNRDAGISAPSEQMMELVGRAVDVGLPPVAPEELILARWQLGKQRVVAQMVCPTEDGSGLRLQVSEALVGPLACSKPTLALRRQLQPRELAPVMLPNLWQEARA